MRKFLHILFLILPAWVTATHIVGGEFELRHIPGGITYQLNMILYFDVLHGDPLAQDGYAQVMIFRKRDNMAMQSYYLFLTDSTRVGYTQPACSHGEVVTNKLIYSSTIELSPGIYNDPGGYYISWERCCRNYSITNVISNDPLFGTYAGQTFYLEFPAVVKDGQPFIDSTPRLFPPLNDYASPNRPYYANFAGIDDDGDSLVYSMVVPLNTKSGDALPPSGLPRPAPYPPVSYRPPYNFHNIMGGHPDLTISKDGLLRVTPGFQGLFAFAVKVEEFRNKVKIGETRRDFQLLVVDASGPAVPPVIMGKKLLDPAYTYSNNMNVSFDNTVSNDDRCIMVRVSDDDSNRPEDSYLENVSIKAVALNFKGDAGIVLPAVTAAVLDHGSTAEFRICLPDCPFLFGGPAEIAIIAMDDACSLPLMDTLKISVTVEPPPNHKPVFDSPNPVNATLNEGQQGLWPYAVHDEDNDPMIISLVTNGFALATAGMTFQTLNQVAGAVDGQLAWDAFCDIYDFTKRTDFKVTVIAEDQDRCNAPSSTSAVYDLHVILPGNADPVIDTDLTPALSEREVNVTRRIYESLSFTVTGTDLTDNDFLVLKGSGTDFAWADYGINVSTLPISGNGSVGAQVQWNLTCTTINPKIKDLLNFQFIVADNANKCRIYKADTVDVHVNVLPPLNQSPLLTITNDNSAETLFYNNTITMERGPKIKLLVSGADGDVAPLDHLKLAMLTPEGTPAPEGLSFQSSEGTSPLTSIFTWQPGCEAFLAGKLETDYKFTFTLNDDRCYSEKGDTVSVYVRLKDLGKGDSTFVPPNFFSPNGDNVNDYYAMEAVDPETKELTNILPIDNCQSQFKSVHIYNRWGKEVFTSSDRQFRWYGQNESPGVYFYSIRFSNKEYRGSLTLRY